ncbi:hypothetical protein GJ629_05965 [Halapricum sp. CBA1109]|uniref:DUF7562 family protein n=1 Tax=Halapricum sp. CBA1109 TaxID=2668068 RepID=UPI0012F918F2|nr:hypothetical protein [Halapricum sp. CBA1109]MUV89496.1 hypothetical protein [Halapricum sp. CBA1109]
MFGSRGGEAAVTCIACGEEIQRGDAREYDKHGNRWERTDKEFEFLCKPCHGDICHQPRDGLEQRLIDIGAGESDRETFLSSFVAADRDRSPASERDER